MSVKQENNISKVDQKQVRTAIAKLKNCPTSPRKMRLVADQIRGLDANKALILFTIEFPEYLFLISWFGSFITAPNW